MMRTIKNTAPIIFFYLFIFQSICLSKPLIIKEVIFIGNDSFNEKQLKNIIVSKPAGLLRDSYFYKDLVKEDLKSLTLFYHQNGYLKAQALKFDTTQFENRFINLTFHISEGPLTRIDTIRFAGNLEINAETLAALKTIHRDHPLVQKKIEETSLKILQHYGNSGYLEATVNPELSIDSLNNKANIQFQIIEGRLFYAGDIQINGIHKTRPEVIQREIKIKKGDILRYKDLIQIQKKLYLTGLYESVYVEPDSILSDNLTNIRVSVKEIDYGEFNASIGYGTVEKVRLRSELLYQNLMHMGRQAGLGANISYVDRGLNLSYTDKWLFNQPLRFDLAFRNLYREEPGYTFMKYAGTASFGFSIYNQIHSIFELKQDYTTLSDITISPVPEDIKSRIRSVKWTLKWDSRDNLFNTKHGIYLESSHEYGRVFTEGSERFFRVMVTGKQLFEINQTSILGTALQLGFITTPGGISNIPLQERFYLGGSNNIRGFDYRKLGPYDNKRTPTGGMISCAIHVFEYRFPIYKLIDGVLFTDGGNIWTSYEDVDVSDLRFASGLGIRIKTILGVARLDYAWKHSVQSHEPKGAIAIGIGQIF